MHSRNYIENEDSTVKPTDWANIKDTIAELATLASNERAARIAGLELEAPVRGELEELLALDERARDFMSIPASGFTSGLLGNGHEPETSRIGERVGPFEVVRELGSGGMGTVYLAERRDGKFEQQVALKVLKREFDIPEVREAFTREIDIQAKLVHPDIAKVLDTGVTADGTPVIVMEFVDGQAIDAYAKENDLSTDEKLKLFNRACESVSFAHSNLIIHRDLKPSNILVTPDGRPKLLDFGIAELVAPGHTEKALAAMTPKFASPEQLAGERVTTATDIYSLGVILHKLLTDEYPPLSVALKGDIAAIVSKAIADDPAARYRTVDELTRDIWDLIDRKPVSAMPQTSRYRLSRFLARRKLAVAAAVVVTLSLIGGAGVALWQARAARAQAIRAQEAQSKAEKVSKFMYKVLSYAHNTWYAEGRRWQGQAKVVDAMFDLSDKIDIEFKDDPDIAAEMHHKFCDILPSDETNRRLFHARRAYELRTAFYGPKHELVAKDMYYLYVTKAPEITDRPRWLADAIDMIRETNPDNLNFPYMVEDYTSRMLLAMYAVENQPFTEELGRRTGENPLAIAERLSIEADRTFHIHYPEVNAAIAANTCRLAAFQIMLRKPEAAQTEKRCRDQMPLIPAPTFEKYAQLLDSIKQ